MKLKLRIDLEGKRREVEADIDASFSRLPPLAAIYDVKFALAQRKDQLLSQEAGERGTTVEGLSQLIMKRRREADVAMMELDSLRRKLKVKVRDAKSEQEIEAVRAEALRAMEGR